MRLLDKLLQYSLEKLCAISRNSRAKTQHPRRTKLAAFRSPPVSRFCTWICKMAREFSSECCNNLSNNRSTRLTLFFRERSPQRGGLRSQTLVTVRFTRNFDSNFRNSTQKLQNNNPKKGKIGLLGRKPRLHFACIPRMAKEGSGSWQT